VATLITELSARAVPGKAAAMKRYMRDQFEFMGLQSPPLREILTPYIKGSNSLARRPTAEVLSVVKRLWKEPCREYQIAACHILRAHARHANSTMLARAVHKLLTKKPWWDTVDSLSAVMGELLDSPDALSMLDAWIQDSSHWVRRCAIISQRLRGRKTNASKLFAFCRTCAKEKEFFVAKGIGWALRSYRRVDEKAVRKFVGSVQLQPLSEREALKGP